jgi:hypothetical protein
MARPYVQNVPVKYMDLQTLWNDRRDPHANPLSTSPRREEANTGDGGLGHLVEQIFRPKLGSDADRGVGTDRLLEERLPFKGSTGSFGR